MAIIPNNESFISTASGNIVTNTLGIFQNAMDSLLLGGHSITLDLPAHKTPCNDADCKYNPTYDKWVGTNSALCSSCKGQGYIYETRQTVFRCNRRWTNEPLDQVKKGGQDTPGGRIWGNFVRVKTHIDSFNYIQQSLGATIDDLKVKLFREPRKTGWNGTNLYVISWWERMNK